jgi:flagella basal body P-ring formation protein FlgA
MIFLLSLLLAQALGTSACIEVEGEWIVAGDLAKAVPQLRSLRSDLAFGWAPKAGVRRVIDAVELERWARQHSLVLPNETLAATTCVVRPRVRLDRQTLLAAVRRDLEREFGLMTEEREVSFTESPEYLAAAGEVRFARSGLRRGRMDGEFVWNGVSCGGPVREPVLVRLQLRKAVSAVRLRHPVRAGALIQDEDLESVKLPWVPEAASWAERSELLGRELRRSLGAGIVLRRDFLRDTGRIRRGESLVVQSKNGQATVEFQAVAPRDVRFGDAFVVLVPSTGKLVRAVAMKSGLAQVGGGGPK